MVPQSAVHSLLLPVPERDLRKRDCEFQDRGSERNEMRSVEDKDGGKQREKFRGLKEMEQSLV